MFNDSMNISIVIAKFSSSKISQSLLLGNCSICVAKFSGSSKDLLNSLSQSSLHSMGGHSKLNLSWAFKGSSLKTFSTRLHNNSCDKQALQDYWMNKLSLRLVANSHQQESLSGLPMSSFRQNILPWTGWLFAFLISWLQIYTLGTKPLVNWI